MKISSPNMPDEATVEAWLSGELTEAEARQLESDFDLADLLPSDSNEFEAELAALETVETDPEVTGLIDLIKSRGVSSFEAAETRFERWREFVEPPPADCDAEVLGVLGIYQMEKVIAIGGMGVVFRALDPDLKRVAAVKMIAPGLTVNANACERFLREARAAAKLEHENILPIYGVYREPIPHFAMRFADGGTLQEKVRKSGPLEFNELKTIAVQIASALGSAHQQGIVHRDIKPANILFSTTGTQLWVCDFGIARSMDDPSLTYAGIIAGTPQFMSPEQAAGEEVDFRSDLFSLGAVLYFAMTGQPLFEGKTTASVLQHATERGDIRVANRSLPTWFRRLLESLLSREPSDRPASALEVIDFINRETSPLSPRERRSRRRFLLTAGSMGVAGVAGGGFLQSDEIKEKLRSLVAWSGGSNRSRISILETGEEFQSLSEVFEKAANNETIVLEGRIVSDREYGSPPNKSLRIIAGKGGATVVATHNRHALFIQGAGTVENIRFERLNWNGSVSPLLGIAPRPGGEKITVRVVNCHFESRPPLADAGSGTGLALTDCRHAEVIDCSFELPNGSGILIASYGLGARESKVDCRNLSMNVRTAFHRRNPEETAYHRVITENCVFLCDYVMVDNYRNPFFTWHVGFFNTVFDCRQCFYFVPELDEAVFIQRNGWVSKRSVFPPNLPILGTNATPRRLDLPGATLKIVVPGMKEFSDYIPRFQSELDVEMIPFDRQSWAQSGGRLRDLRKFATRNLEKVAGSALNSLEKI